MLAAHWCWSEVCNGGLHQFFSNSTGVLAPEAVEGLNAVGVVNAAKITSEAMSFFGEPYLREWEQRNVILDNMTGESRKEFDPFYKLDNLFYESIYVSNDSDYFEKMATEYAKRIS